MRYLVHRFHHRLVNAERRRLFGSETYCLPPRFIDEIPKELINEVRPRVHVSRSYQAISSTTSEPADTGQATDGLQLGQHVRHKKFGDGIVINYEGQGSNARVQVNFHGAGIKWLVMGYANLEQVGA